MLAFLYSFHIKINKQTEDTKIAVKKTGWRHEGSARHKNYLIYELKILN